MKKVLLALSLLAVVGTADAQCCYRHGYRWGGPGIGWVPLVAGVVIGAEIASQPHTVIVEQQPTVVYTQPPVQQPPAGFHWQQMIDPQTNTAKIVLVPN
jgi:hypothetical protein